MKRAALSLARSSLFLLVVLSSLSALAAGTLTDNIVNKSSILGYKLQYRVYQPENHEQLDKLPVVYVTDGQWFIKNGAMVGLLDRMIAQGKIKPLVAVFVDNRDPDNLRDNRRNRQFFCNPDYAKFYVAELVPHIEKRYSTSPDASDRGIMGMSFGGLNAACFGLMASDTFGMLGILSPALGPVPGIYEAYENAPLQPLRIFLSHGGVNDNERSGKRFYRALAKKGYSLKYKTSQLRHNWRNWKPLLDDVLLYFFRA